MNRILVTGANGFVGAALCTELLARGYTVRAAVRSSTQFPDGVEMVIVGSVVEEIDWTQVLIDVNVVIHLVARVHVLKDSSPDPLKEFLGVNLHGTRNLAKQAARAGVKRFVYVSTIKVNGEETSARQKYSENDVPAPKDAYGISKWQAEQALHCIARETKLEIVIVRPPLIYGPGVKGNFLSLLHAIFKGIPLPLAGANNARSLVYVGNFVDALISCSTHPAAAGQTYLVRDGEDVSTAALAAKIAVALACHNRTFYFPPGILHFLATIFGRSEQVNKLFGSLCLNDEKICSELGWVPPYTVEQGLKATVDWYLERVKSIKS